MTEAASEYERGYNNALEDARHQLSKLCRSGAEYLTGHETEAELRMAEKCLSAICELIYRTLDSNRERS